MDVKFKEKHYKNSRFNTKSEKDLSQFKKDNTQKAVENKIEMYQRYFLFPRIIGVCEKIKDVDCIKTKPKKGIQDIYFTTNNTNSAKILHIFNEIDELYVSLAVINEFAVNILEKKQINKILGRKQNEDFISQIINDMNCEKSKNENHTKFYLIKEKDNYYCIISSANPKKSDYIESYSIYNDEYLFNGLKNYINDF
jgi:phage-related protein